MTTWEVINLVVDICFAIDIFVVFLSAFYDHDFQIIDNAADIARNYIFGWFFLDVLAITPFDLISAENGEKGNNNMN